MEVLCRRAESSGNEVEAEANSELAGSIVVLVPPQCVEAEVSSSDGDKFCHIDVKFTSIELQKVSPVSCVSCLTIKVLQERFRKAGDKPYSPSNATVEVT